MHMATVPTGIIGYIESPITTVKPSRYRISDLIILIFSKVVTYHLELTEPINVHYQNMKQMILYLESTHIDLYKDPFFKKTVCSVQPSQKLAPRVFPLSAYPKSKLTISDKNSFSIL